MVFAAHTFRCHLEYCQSEGKQIENVSQEFYQSPIHTLTLHIVSLNRKIVITSVMAVDM